MLCRPEAMIYTWFQYTSGSTAAQKSSVTLQCCGGLNANAHEIQITAEDDGLIGCRFIMIWA